MLDWKEQWLESGKFPFTPSVVDLHGVEAACDVILDEGLEASFERHERAAAACRAGARAMEIDLWPVSDEVCGGLRDRARRPRRPDGHAGARPLPRALRRHDLRRAGRGQPRPHRAHGADGAVALPGRSASPPSAARSLDLGAPVKLGDGLEAALQALSHRPRRSS